MIDDDTFYKTWATEIVQARIDYLIENGWDSISAYEIAWEEHYSKLMEITND